MASGVGVAELDFGAFPGANEASVAVADQAEITTLCSAEAWIMADDTTTEHTASDHKYAPEFFSVTCGTPTAATGFTIYGRSIHKMQGKFAVRWVWSD